MSTYYPPTANFSGNGPVQHSSSSYSSTPINPLQRVGNAITSAFYNVLGWNSLTQGYNAFTSGKQFLQDQGIIPSDDEKDPGTTYRRSSGGTRVLDYYNAPMATRYGMDAATAYQEALANTAHQREVADLQAAGLNPILSTRYGGSAGVSGATVLSSGSGSGFGPGNSQSQMNLTQLMGLAGLAAGLVSASKTGRIRDVYTGINTGKALGSLFSSK